RPISNKGGLCATDISGDRLPCYANDRHDPHPVPLIRHRNQLLPVSAPFDVASHAEERTADLAEGLAIPADRDSQPQPGRWHRRVSAGLPSSLTQIGGMGTASSQEDRGAKGTTGCRQWDALGRGDCPVATDHCPVSGTYRTW